MFQYARAQLPSIPRHTSFGQVTSSVALPFRKSKEPPPSRASSKNGGMNLFKTILAYYLRRIEKSLWGRQALLLLITGCCVLLYKLRMKKLRKPSAPVPSLSVRKKE